MKCQVCGFSNSPHALHCGGCGAQLSAAQGSSASSPTMSIHLPPRDLPRGSTFAGRFEVLEKLGEGGMGAVYRVVDKRISEEIALKLLRPEVAADARAVERFKNELKLARRIIHKSICRMYDLNEHEGAFYITMEYVPGEDLKTVIRRDGACCQEKVISIGRQVAEGLQEAHRLGVVHRDLKPQNVMLDREGAVRILDFGLARFLGASELTEAGTILGTLDYMAPEQVSGQAADARSDIYSLGIILYEVATGRLPFTGETALTRALVRQTAIPTDPCLLNGQLSTHFSRLILKCLERKPECRYQTSADLLSGLNEIESGLSGMPSAAAPARKEAVPSEESGETVRSIAVLPFKDMSPQRDQEYFCDGLAEELINALTHVRGLRVAARTSAFSFKKKEADIREIGRLLNVGTVLEGSIQKSGNRIRITAQLINIADGYHLWSERFERKMKDIFVVQDDISLAIVEKLKVELLAGEKEKITKRHTQNKGAYNLYLKGRYLWNRRYQGDMIRAVDYYHRAIAKDPDFALPYVGIANVFNILGQWAYIHPKHAYARSKTMLQKALEIDGSLSEIYSALGFMTAGYEWDVPAAISYYRRSIELNPKNAYGHHWLATALLAQKPDESIAELRKAIELDPLFALPHALLGLFLQISGTADNGRDQALKAIAMDPAQPMSYLFMGMACLARPAAPELAVQYLEKAADFGLIFALGWLGIAYAALRRNAEAEGILKKLEETEKENYLPLAKKALLYLKPGLKDFRFMKKKYVSPLLKAFIHAALNRPDAALEHLEMSAQNRDYFLAAILGTDLRLIDFPWIEDMRSHVRFKALREKIKLS